MTAKAETILDAIHGRLKAGIPEFHVTRNRLRESDGIKPVLNIEVGGIDVQAYTMNRIDWEMTIKLTLSFFGVREQLDTEMLAAKLEIQRILQADRLDIPFLISLLPDSQSEPEYSAEGENVTAGVLFQYVAVYRTATNEV